MLSLLLYAGKPCWDTFQVFIVGMQTFCVGCKLKIVRLKIVKI